MGDLDWVDELDLGAARQEVKERINSELHILEKAGMPSYSVWLIYWEANKKDIRRLHKLRASIAERGCVTTPDNPCGSCPGCLCAIDKEKHP